MNNFELIDDYLSNRLEGDAKEGFEKQLANDPTLRSELDLQQQIVEGIRKARASELKSMLNKVPVGGGTVIEFQVVRVAAGLVAAGLIAAAIYFYATRGELPPFEKAATNMNKPAEQVQPEEQKSNDQQEQAQPSDENKKEEATPEKKEKKKEEQVVVPAERPKLDVANPTDELAEQSKNEDISVTPASRIAPSHVEVSLDSSNKKYDFHYQFRSGKLTLYGSFDKSLYQVLEINGDKHSVFLFYKDVFYQLDEQQEKITKLEPIKDAALIKALKEYKDR